MGTRRPRLPQGLVPTSMPVRGTLDVLALARGRGRNKYGVSRPEERTVDGILFASKAEARRWKELELLRRAGSVRFVLRQVPFHLPGGVRYVVDFAVFWADGRTSFEDVKGHRTEVYRLKRRQVQALYPVTIEEVRARR